MKIKGDLSVKKCILWIMCYMLMMLLVTPTVSVRATAYLDLNLIEEWLSEEDVFQLLPLLPKEAHLSDPEIQLVNKDNRLEEEPNFPQAYTAEGHRYHAGVQQDFEALLKAGQEAGYTYQTLSAYRSMQMQLTNCETRYQYYLNNGMSQEDAQYWLDAYYAPMDGSEHLLGLAFDILGTKWLAQGGLLTIGYAQTEEYQWMSHHAHEYGFILRFPDDKVDITGYFFEPWHYRYVGKIHAKFMYEHNLTLEEYTYLIQRRQSKLKTLDENKAQNEPIDLEPNKKGTRIH